MRIGLDGRLWGESGVGRYIRNLVWELSKIDKENQYILFFRDKNRVRPRNLSSNWRLVEVNVRWHTLEEQIRFPSILNHEQLDLMHFPYFSVPLFYNKPFIVTIHDLILHHFPTGEASTLPPLFYKIKLLGYKFVISQAAKRAKKIITVSKTTKKEIVDHLGVSPDKVVVTYEGTTLASSKKPLATSSKNYTTKRYFLYVGNAYPHKNLEQLLQALDILIRQLADPNISLVLVGKEDYFYRKLREQVRRMKLTKHILFYGDANDEELASLYRNAKALILPSLMEGFGLPALEAMANGCLVLASDIPALRELCADAAIYSDPKSVEQMAKMIGDVYSNDTYYYSDNIRKGIKRAKMFSWRRMVEETLNIYESCTRL